MIDGRDLDHLQPIQGPMSTESCGYRQLATAILRLALQDARAGRHGAITFLIEPSDARELWASLAGVEPAAMGAAVKRRGLHRR